MDTAAPLAALMSGGVIGLILSLVGGGGSILAVPLLIYVVGVESPHAAIGRPLSPSLSTPRPA